MSRKIVGSITDPMQAIDSLVRVPAERCIAIEEATAVSRHDLYLDVFGPAPANYPAQEVDRAA